MNRYKIRVDILDQNDLAVGDGPIYEVLSASVTRALDGAGSIKINLPGSESRANDLIQNERRANVYLNQTGYDPRLIGSGVLRSINVGGSSSGWTLSAGGPDRFDDLKRHTTLLRREYLAQTAETVFQSLASIAGWTADVESAIASNLLTARFDGESVLKAFQAVVENYGYHARLDTTAKVIEVGMFGDSSGIVAINPKQWTKELEANADIVLIDKITVKRDTESLINWLMPIGGGEGLASLTLADSTRTSPYVVKSLTGPDGTLQYYIEDTTSIAAYGTSRKTGTFKDINPLDNTDAATLIAANALYDASAAFLERASQRLDTYTLTIKKLDATIRPGNKVRVVYRGLIYDSDGNPVDFLSVDEDLWVMKITETINRNSISAKLIVTTVDRQEFDAAKIIIGAIEELKLKNLKVQPYPATSSFVYLRQMDSTHSADVPIELTNGVLYLDRCRVRLTTRPFRATAKSADAIEGTTGTSGAGGATTPTSTSGGSSTPTSTSGGSSSPTTSSGGSSAPTSAGGGDHRHVMFRLETDVASATVRGWVCAADSGGIGSQHVAFRGPGTGNLWTNDGSGSHTHTVTIAGHTHNVTIPAHTHDVSIPGHTHDVSIPDHTHDVTVPGHGHDLSYGISDDTDTPNTISVKINGTDRTTALGGPWGVGGGNVDVSFDIAEYLNTSSGGLRQKHDVVFSCVSGQGEAEVLIELKTTVQSIQQTA